MKKEERFIHEVKEYYKRHGRQSLPWRLTHDPYRILVSEIMLQQTQVDRVIEKYHSFLKAFPSLEALAASSLGSVLREWQGLGYNRRAKMLHECAKMIVNDFRGLTPKTMEDLQSLPGIGPYTAGAIMAFAFNKPIPLIETNIRSVYLHHFYNDSTDVPDKELMMLIEKTLDKKDPRSWYAALMDYGSHLKKTIGNPNSRSKHYVRQASFKGSDREIRGAILRELAQGPKDREALIKTIHREDVRIDAQLEKLTREGMVILKRKKYALPD